MARAHQSPNGAVDSRRNRFSKIRRRELFGCTDARAPLGYESRPDAPESVGAFLAEVEIWSRVIKQAGIGPEK